MFVDSLLMTVGLRGEARLRLNGNGRGKGKGGRLYPITDDSYLVTRHLPA